jgi:hypothetical protein
VAKHKTHSAGDGSDVPSESVELEGAIVTAAKSTMEALDQSSGYSRPNMFLGMNQIQKVGGKR